MAFFRKSGTAAAPRPTPPPVAAPRPVSGRPEHVAVEARSLREAELSTEGRLLLPGRAAALPGGRVALSISGIEQAPFAITGTMRAVRGGGGPRIDLEVDEDQRGLLARILEHVKKGAERPRIRAPRLQISMPAVVSTPDGSTYMNTFSLSRGGCGLRWSGPPPRVGSTFLVRLGAGFSAPSVRATVCWVREQGPGLRVGFRFVGGHDGRLESLLDTAESAAGRP